MIAQLHVQAGDHAAAASALRKALAVADVMLNAGMHLGTTIFSQHSQWRERLVQLDAAARAMSAQIATGGGVPPVH